MNQQLPLRRAASAVRTSLLLLFAIAVVGLAQQANAIRFWGEEEKAPGAGPAAEAENAPSQAAIEGKPQVASLPNFADLAENLRPMVVNISTTTEPELPPMGHPQPFGRDPYREFWEPFERFFGPMPRQRYKQRSLGSGFILNREGLILTNNHVVENADEIVVQLANEKEYKAKLVGRDPKTDIAVIKIDVDDGEELKPVVLGDSDQLRVGEWIFAIGNPFGLSSTVTAGIVSAKGRFIGQGNYDDFIQTDAAINPGNSGGPLVNLKGEVVGINSAIFSRSGGNIGIGFAIPINLAKELLPQLQEKGKVTRGWLGVYIQRVTAEIAESLELKSAHGALVADVMPDTPAKEAGIEVGDVIIEFDGHPVKDSTDLPNIVARTPIGKKTTVRIIRAGKTQSLTVTIGELKDEEVTLAGGKSAEFGLAVQTLTPEIAENLGVDPSTKGVVVASVEPGSAAEDAGLQRGDVILEVNREAVQSESSYQNAIKKAGTGKSVLFLVRRGENTIFVALKPPSE